MIKTYLGSCHCGAIRFEADINLVLRNEQMQLLDLHENTEPECNHRTADSVR